MIVLYCQDLGYLRMYVHMCVTNCSVYEVQAQKYAQDLGINIQHTAMYVEEAAIATQVDVVSTSQAPMQAVVDSVPLILTDGT